MFGNLGTSKKRRSIWPYSQDKDPEPSDSTEDVPEIDILRKAKGEIPNFAAQPPIVTRQIE